jgi:hypothetical protein
MHMNPYTIYRIQYTVYRTDEERSSISNNNMGLIVIV